MWIVALLLLCFLAVCLVCWPTSGQNLPAVVALGASDRRTVFVLVPQVSDARFVDGLFQTARNPLRVFVGVGSSCPPQPNVRCASREWGFGHSIARQVVFEELYQNEDFVLCLRPNMVLAQDWDACLVDSARPGAVLSYWPSDGLRLPTTTFPVFDKFVNRIPKFRGVHAETALRVAFRIGLATFDCVFAARGVLDSLLDLGLPHINDCEDDWLLSWFLCSRLVNVLTPPRALALRISKDVGQKRDPTLRNFTVRVVRAMTLDDIAHHQTEDAKKTAQEDENEGDKAEANGVDVPVTKNPRADGNESYLLRHARMTPEFLDDVGIDLARQQVAGRCRLGLPFEDYSEPDILYRFGTMNRFHELKSKVV